jgi:hypothetical protein
MKKTMLSLVAASLAASSLGAYAALPTSAAPFQVVVPNLKSGVELTLEGLYVQPTSSDLGYNTLFTFPNSNNNNVNATVNYLKPKFDFGFRAAVGYIFPNSGNDVQLSWTHFDHSDNDSSALFPTFTFNFNEVPTTVSAPSSTETTFKYDAVDLDVGQYVSIGTRLQTRLFFGLRGAQLKQDTTTTRALALDFNFRETSASAMFVNTESSNSKFVGLGPRAGIDASYHVGDCFGIVGHFAGALLVGNVDADTTSASTATFVPPGNAQPTSFSFTDTYTADTQTRVVPAFDAKLGVDYTFPFNKSLEDSSISIEAGYQVTQYIDPIDRIVPVAPAPLALGSWSNRCG